MKLLSQPVKEHAYELGFDLCGVAPAGRAPHADAYASWVDAGCAAEMGYMVRDVARRQDPRLVLPGVRSVVVVGLSYFTASPPPCDDRGLPPRDVWDDPARGRIARYAWGADYHEAMLPRLQQLAQFIRTLAGHEVQQRAYVDTGPLLERDVAARAGLGFIGRNTCLISPAWGSFLFLGEILLDVELEYDEPERLPLAPQTARDFAKSPHGARHYAGDCRGTCGACTRCLAACPTGALVAPYVLDSRRCISYLTIELKGSIPVELRPRLGNRIFGCDACQSVCPWPRRFAHAGRQGFLRFEADRCAPRLVELMGLDEAQFRARFKGTPLLRAKRRGLLRNVAVALANWGDATAVPALRAAAQDADPLVREHAAWALARFR